jgi:hypothetical protein
MNLHATRMVNNKVTKEQSFRSVFRVHAKESRLSSFVPLLFI